MQHRTVTKTKSCQLLSTLQLCKNCDGKADGRHCLKGRDFLLLPFEIRRTLVKALVLLIADNERGEALFLGIVLGILLVDSVKKIVDVEGRHLSA